VIILRKQPREHLLVCSGGIVPGTSLLVGPGDLQVSSDKKTLYVTVKSITNEITGPGQTQGGGRLMKFDISNAQAPAFATQIQDTIVGAFSMAINDDGYVLLTSAEGKDSDTHPPIFTGYLSVYDAYTVDEITKPDLNITSLQLETGPTCWIRYMSQTGCTYTASAFAGSAITAFRSVEDRLEMLSAVPIPAPIDLFISPDQRFLYAISTGYAVDTLGLLPPEVNGIDLTALVGDTTPQDQQSAIYTYKINPNSCELTQVEITTDKLPTVAQNRNGIVGMVAI